MVPWESKGALWLYKVYGNSTLLVLNGTSLNGNNALLAHIIMKRNILLHSTHLINSVNALLALSQRCGHIYLFCCHFCWCDWGIILVKQVQPTFQRSSLFLTASVRPTHGSSWQWEHIDAWPLGHRWGCWRGWCCGGYTGGSLGEPCLAPGWTHWRE